MPKPLKPYRTARGTHHGMAERGQRAFEPAPDVTGEWYSLDKTFVMEPGEARIPKAPIQ